MADAIDPQQTPTPEPGAQAYDISGDKPVLGEVPHEQLQQAVTSGKYSLPKNQEINVVSPDGTFGTIPTEQAEDAFNSGYKYATPKMLSGHAEEEQYGTPGQQVIAGLEGAAQGVAGPLAPLAEKALGVDPKDILKRAEYNPITHGLAEAGGFGVSSLYGVGEAGLIGKAAEAVSGAHQLAENANIASRLAVGATKMATEMGLYQAGDEASKAILDAPNSPGQAASNIGLSALIGGLAHIPLAGLGAAGNSIMNSQALKDFSDRLAFRGSNLEPAEMMQKEMTDAVNSFHQIGDEVGGVSGIKAQALTEALPKEVTPEIATQVQDVSTKAQVALQKMIEKDAPKRLIQDYQSVANNLMEVASNPNATVAQQFDAINQFKNDLQDYSRGRWGLNAVQRTAEDYHFVTLTKELSRDVRMGLENPQVWGDAASVQKDINAAWTKTLPYVKQVTSGFMSKVGDQFVVDPQKFASYISQAGKATSETVRQQRLGGFLEGLEQFHKTLADVTEKAGIENPVSPVGLGMLKESVNSPSVGTKLADLWYDKVGPKGLGDVLGGVTGGAIGHATGIPEAGISGAYLGKWALGPVFSSVIKPIMEHGPNMPAFRAATSYGKAIMSGNATLTNAAANIFAAGAKTVPSHLMPNDESIAKLDKQIKTASANPQSMFNVSGDLGKYAPDHAQALSQAAMTAVNTLNAQRPVNPKQSPLDSDIPVTKAQEAKFHRSLAVAEQPLSCFEHIKNGTLQPSDVATVKSIYGPYYNKMSQELVNAMTDHISGGGTVPYKTRQAASLFLGQPLDSTMTPNSISSIQGMFAQNKPMSQAQPQGKSKKGSPSKLSKLSTNLQTPDQSRAERANKS